jgi:hypothetical protein
MLLHICFDDNLKSYQLYIFDMNTGQCYELTKNKKINVLSPICLMLDLTKVL